MSLLLNRTTFAATKAFQGHSSRFAAVGRMARRPIQQQQRFMSVITLEGKDEVDKFRMTNAKSIMYFTATWCPPCKVIKPIYETLAKENTDIAFGKVDVDDNSDASLEFDITAVPTFIFFNGEKPLDRMAGADETMLKKNIEALKKAV